MAKSRVAAEVRAYLAKIGAKGGRHASGAGGRAVWAGVSGGGAVAADAGSGAGAMGESEEDEKEGPVTCIFSKSTPDVLIQVSDRRLTRPDGELFNDHTNKVVIFDGRMAVGYSGLSKILGEKTDEWLVRILSDPLIRSLAHAVYTVQDRATAAFRGWARMPRERARHHLIFGFVGWMRRPGGQSLQVVVGFVSNCHDERAALQTEARDDFRVHRKILDLRDAAGMLTTGVRLSSEESRRLNERIGAATSLDSLTLALVQAVREVGARDKTVGNDVLAVTIPRVVVEEQERTGSAPMMLMGPPLTFDSLGSLYFPENKADPIQYAPNFVYAGIGLTDIQGGPIGSAGAPA